MAVVAWRNAIVGAGLVHLFKFKPAIISAGFRKTGLQKPATTTTAEIIGPIGGHIDEVLFTDHRFDNKTKFFGDGIAKGFSNQLAGILDGKLRAYVLVPVRVNFEFAFPDPLGIISDNALGFKIVFDVEFVQSDPD